MLGITRVWRVSPVAQDEELMIGWKPGNQSHKRHRQREEEK